MAATKKSEFRLEDKILLKLDQVALHEAQARGANANRTAAIRAAVTEAFEARRPAMAANAAAWAHLVGLAGSTASLLTLHGEGDGDPLPEQRSEMMTPDGRPATNVVPSRWRTLKVSIALSGQTVDLPLIVETAEHSPRVDVFLTDESGLAKLFLGPLDRTVSEHSAYYDNRLHRIADDLRMP